MTHRVLMWPLAVGQQERGTLRQPRKLDSPGVALSPSSQRGSSCVGLPLSSHAARGMPLAQHWQGPHGTLWTHRPFLRTLSLHQAPLRCPPALLPGTLCRQFLGMLPSPRGTAAGLSLQPCHPPWAPPRCLMLEGTR